MAQIREVRLVDDLDGSPADETVKFGLDGKSYEIDLTTDHAKALRENLLDFVEKARRAGRPEVAPVRERSRPGRTPREQTAAIRDWARSQGHQVSDRGRIPASILREFEAAHGGSAA